MIGFTVQKNDRGQCRLVWSTNENVIVTHWHNHYAACLQEFYSIVPHSYSHAKEIYPDLVEIPFIWNNRSEIENWELLLKQNLLKPIEED